MKNSHEIIQDLAREYDEHNVAKLRYVVRKAAKVQGLEVKRGRGGALYDSDGQAKIRQYIEANYQMVC